MAQKGAPARLENMLPACPIPFVIQPADRIEWLKERLKEPDKRQTTNLLALIKMYETGELGPLSPGYRIFICEGKIVDSPAKGNFRFGNPPAAIWIEVSLCLLDDVSELRKSLTILLGNCDANDAAKPSPG
ncbi:hypothetical protein N7488_000990 [Penicillium malachiteum]|nr:hypothetical protein N7488_000990 [Penicillium malachiteum]